MKKRVWMTAIMLAIACAAPAKAQQRPLVTEDPETIGSGNILIEGGFDEWRDVTYPLAGSMFYAAAGVIFLTSLL